MTDVRCPLCGSLLGRVEGKAELRCRKARCFAVSEINTEIDEIVVVKYGSKGHTRRANIKRRISEVTAQHAAGEYQINSSH